MSTRQRIMDLLQELDTFRDRYRNLELPDEIESMNLAIGRRARRVEFIRSQLTELIDEMSRLEAEIAGCHKGYEALLEDTIDRIKARHREAWSPFPVTGFRMWSWQDGALHGAWERWHMVTKEATCRHPGELPHSNGACGRLGCGVYATKALDPLLTSRIDSDSHGFVCGTVELTGKVVEHDEGYRAARAEVRAAVMVGVERVAWCDDADGLDQMFADADRYFASAGVPRPPDVGHEIRRFLTQRERETPWTSDRRSA